MKGSKMMRRIISTTLSLVLAVSGSIYAVSSAKAADVELTMYSWRVEDKAFYEDVIRTFKAKILELILHTSHFHLLIIKLF